MSEFKTIVEDFKSEQKRISEYMLHLSQKMETGFSKVVEDIHSLKEQVVLLHEGQTEIKIGLKRKVDTDEFEGKFCRWT